MGQESLFVRISCYEQVYWKRIPTKCPQCGKYSSYDSFEMVQIEQWGSPILIGKAGEQLRDALKARLEGK
ncbi:MAG: hypothetical protein ACREIG_05105 [Nitrospiraceae bacterium]